MTVLVGVKCSDGVVIGADSIATSGAGNMHLLQMHAEKIVIVGEKIIVAGTGSVGLGQRFSAVVEKAWSEKRFGQNIKCTECCKFVTTATIQDFQSTGVQGKVGQGFGFGALMAAPMEGKSELVEFASNDFQPEIKNDSLHSFRWALVKCSRNPSSPSSAV